MKKMMMCILMLLIVGCQKQEPNVQNENWYMAVKSTKSDAEYIPFLDEAYFTDSSLEEIKKTEGVEEVQPIYIFDTNLTEPGKLDSPYGNVKVYKDADLVSEYFYDPAHETVKSFQLINILGYPSGLDMNAYTAVQSKEGVKDGCYLSADVAQQLGISHLDDSYTLEIYCLIPVSNTIDETMLEEYPDLVQDVTNNKQFLYPYTLKIKIAGILNDELSSSRGQLYVPLQLMQALIKEHQIEEVRTNNYLVKVKNNDVLNTLQGLDTQLKMSKYPLEEFKYS
ncbi:hypothetical protein [Beduini massiliensis]|uniref:hypothetical protein n=1 Tax=Beduini massiliensis TaxID=1585974 RepID=UPI00059AB4E4|nr:hypothetical protein [Beduini massiliensis]